MKIEEYRIKNEKTKKSSHTKLSIRELSVKGDLSCNLPHIAEVQRSLRKGFLYK